MSNKQDGVTTTASQAIRQDGLGQAQPPHAPSPDHTPTEASRSIHPDEAVPAHWGRYLVAPRPFGEGITSEILQDLITFLEEDTDGLILDHIDLPSRTGGESHRRCPPIVVVAMPDSRAQALASNPRLIVERDQPLLHTDVPMPAALGIVEPAHAPFLADCGEINVHVVGPNAVPVEEAHIWAVGTTGTTHAVTGRDGRAQLKLSADLPATIRTLHVRPAQGYWPARIDRPFQTGTGGETTISLLSLVDTFRGFPDEPLTGWGIQAMRLDRLPASHRGSGARVALLDAGVSTSHPDLKDIVTKGRDFTTAPERDTWRIDATGRGTWCAGIIAAADNGTGITGIAPEAEIHALKLFPKGRVSDLLRALDHCTTERIDIAQINITYQMPSQLVSWKILDLATAGTVTIAPAGDTPVTLFHTAALPGVLSVGALTRSDQGLRPAPYSPIATDLHAPGTDLITTGHLGGYTAASGTALAAAHITSLAALLLTGHRQLRSHINCGTRVHHLHTLLLTASRPRHPQHTYRLPDAYTAFTDYPTEPVSRAPGY
ncbi:S8 family serine peptidase [Streptomyces lavendulae]|uniref:S8 family serine peptidase n=1 Tax=Streptomyces lavendulae TaxID=1914 RepID=UPI0033E2BE69